MSVANNHARFGKFTQVLLVDDDKFMLEFVGDLLRELGVMNVTTAMDGAQGLAAFDRAAPKPDLVLCDIHMPEQDGFQVMAGLATRGYGRGVILISGQEALTLKSATLMAQFHELNILATLAKPVDKLSLANAMAKL